MSDMINRFRYLIGSILLLLILAGSAFLLWRENQWKPEIERKLVAIENKLEDLKTSLVIGETSEIAVDPAVIIEQKPVQSAPTVTTNKNTGKVAGTSTTTKTSENPVPVTAEKQVAIPIVNINTASLAELDLLPGIGPVYAQRIIDYRASNGGFKTIEEIKNVKGIGDSTFEKMKSYITI